MNIMADNHTIDARWDDSPVDVSTEPIFLLITLGKR